MSFAEQMELFVLFIWLWAAQTTDNWKAQHVPIVVYIQYTSWWWATNMPETYRGWRNKLRINSASSGFLWYSYIIIFLLHPFLGDSFSRKRTPIVIQGPPVQYSCPSSSEVKNKWRYTFTPHICLHGKCKATFTFTLHAQFYLLLVVACHCHSSVCILAVARCYSVLPSPLPTCLNRVICLENFTCKKHALSNSDHLNLFSSLQVCK
jgi:hypothetical protein